MVILNIDQGEVLLGRRKENPYKNHLALPGGFFNPDNCESLGVYRDYSLKHAAIREALEETNLDLRSEKVYFLNYYDDPDRAPARTINFAFVCLVTDSFLSDNPVKPNDDLSQLGWYGIRPVVFYGSKLAFDHKEILNQAYHQFIKT